MNKNVVLGIVAIVVVLLVGGFLARHKIKSKLGMSPAPTQQVMMHPKVTSAPSSSAMAPSGNIYKMNTDSVKGKYLTDFQGMTLYTFDQDTTGVSNCYDQCAKIWPFYTSGATAQGSMPANITVITRKDNAKQFAWKGMPLYYNSKDQKSGDINGDGVGGVWHIVKL